MEPLEQYKQACGLLPQIVALRRALHVCPELGGALMQTRAFVRAELECGW